LKSTPVEAAQIEERHFNLSRLGVSSTEIFAASATGSGSGCHGDGWRLAGILSEGAGEH
jgi:hypothetical protein